MADAVLEPSQQLLRRSDAIGLAHLFGHLTLLAATGGTVVALSTSSMWWWPLGWCATAVHGLALSHLYMPFHESTHGTAFESPVLCQTVAWLLGVLIFMNADSFRFFHREHHEYTQVAGRDPELPGANGALRNYLHKLLGGEMATALWHFCTSAIVGEAGEGPWVPKSARRGVVASIRWQCACYVLSAALSIASTGFRWALVTLWLWPLALAQPSLWGHFILQHTATDTDGDPRHTARVVITHPAYEWLSWGMNYHAVHHMNPRIPFHHLPSAFGASPHLFKHVERRGYLVAHADMLANRVRKLLQQQQ